MYPCKNEKIDPMRAGHPEPFYMPRTIPAAWDLSDFFSSLELSQAEVNGTAYDNMTGSPHDRNDDTQNAV
jgi:hypothetical protein